MRLTMCSLMGTFAGAGAPTGGIAPADATMCQLPLLRCKLRLSSFVLCQPTATNPKNGPAPEYLHFFPMFYSSSKRYLRHAKKQSAPGESQPSCGPNQTPQPRDRLALPRNTKTEHTQKADAHVTTVPTQHRRTRPTILYAAFSNSGVLGGISRRLITLVGVTQSDLTGSSVNHFGQCSACPEQRKRIGGSWSSSFNSRIEGC